MMFLRSMVRRAKLSIACLLLPVLAGTLHAQAGNEIPGLTVGDRLPPISAKDQTGSARTFATLKAKHGLLLLFSRSPEWCPFCKQHLMQFHPASRAFQPTGPQL